MQSTSQLSSSHRSLATWQASQSQRRPSSRGDVVAAEGAHRPLEHRGRCGVPLGDQHGQAVQEEIRRVAAAPAPGRGPRRLGDFQHTAAVGQTTDDDRGPQRVQVGLACERDVERLEPLGGREQQRRARRGRGSRRRRSGARRRSTRARWSSSSGPASRRGQQSEGRVGGAGLVRGLRRGQRALRLDGPGSGVSAVARSRKAAAAARPPRAWARSAERSTSDATPRRGRERRARGARRGDRGRRRGPWPRPARDGRLRRSSCDAAW